MKHHCNYHCFLSDRKIIKQFPPGVIPVDLPNHTPWVRGNGPLSPEARLIITAAIKLATCGVPKSPEQRAKMSAASKGKPKSAEQIGRAHV